MTRAICETLKTRVKLNPNFTRPDAITYTYKDVCQAFARLILCNEDFSVLFCWLCSTLCVVKLVPKSRKDI